jgi:hypothetical protein
LVVVAVAAVVAVVVVVVVVVVEVMVAFLLWTPITRRKSCACFRK